MFLSSFFDHLRFFTAAAGRHGASGEMQIGSMNASLRAHDREVEFLAQFIVRTSRGAFTYSMQYSHDVEGFVGWLPYFNKRWIEAHDKLTFKRRCDSEALPTPPWSTVATSGADLGDFVVKQAEHSSFGYGVRGPFAATSLTTTTLERGHYLEQFIPGQIGKGWFWNDRVAAIELQEPASVVGDGLATLAQLVRRRRRSADIVTVTDFLRFHGLQWERVPAAGEQVVLDFKYGSPFGIYEFGSVNRIEELRGGPIVAQLDSFGPTFWNWVPSEIREGVLYTVDFVVSRDDRLWLLEMNCNPMVPPECYDVIVGAALRGEISGMGAATMTAAADGSSPHAGALTQPLPPMPLQPPPPRAEVPATTGPALH